MLAPNLPFRTRVPADYCGPSLAPSLDPSLLAHCEEAQPPNFSSTDDVLLSFLLTSRGNLCAQWSAREGSPKVFCMVSSAAMQPQYNCSCVTCGEIASR